MVALRPTGEGEERDGLSVVSFGENGRVTKRLVEHLLPTERQI